MDDAIVTWHQPRDGPSRRMIFRILSAFVLSCATALPLAAGDSFETPVRGEILTGWERADGTRMAALHLRLAPGWKTYWRAPGDAGIPPHFDWSGSKYLRSVAITWPTPKVFLTAGMQTIGYSGDLVIPLSLVPRQDGKPMTLKADLDLGVCSDICVPYQMSLKAVIDDTNTQPSSVIAAALASAPFTAKEARATAATCALSPTADGLRIEARLTLPSAGGAEVVVIETGQPDLWMSETKTKRSGGTLVVSGEIIRGDGAPVVIDRSAIRFTVLGKKHAVDIRGCTRG